MTDYTPTGKPEDDTRGIPKQLRDEFALIQAAINSKQNSNLFVLGGTEAQGATVNDYVVTASPAITSYTNGSLVIFMATHANTGAVTLKVSALTAKSLKNVDGGALASGDIVSGALVGAYYDGTDFYLISGNDRVARSGDTYSGAHDFSAATISSPQLDAKAPLASPVLTGVPAGPTAAPGTTTTQLATTAFVMAAAFVAAGNINFQYFTSNSTAILHMEHFLDSSVSGSFTVTMPASPAVGDAVIFTNPFNSWVTAPVTLARNGSNFVDRYGASQAEDFDLDVNVLQVTFIYTSLGWRAV